MTELIHSRRSPFIHTSRYVGGRRKLGCLPREQQPIAANRFKALAAAAAAGAADGAGAAANRSQSLQSTSSSSSGSSSRSGGSSQAQAQAGPLAAASQPFAAGECWLEGQWPS